MAAVGGGGPKAARAVGVRGRAGALLTARFALDCSALAALPHSFCTGRTALLPSPPGPGTEITGAHLRRPAASQSQLAPTGPRGCPLASPSPPWWHPPPAASPVGTGTCCPAPRPRTAPLVGLQRSGAKQRNLSACVGAHWCRRERGGWAAQWAGGGVRGGHGGRALSPSASPTASRRGRPFPFSLRRPIALRPIHPTQARGACSVLYSGRGKQTSRLACYCVGHHLADILDHKTVAPDGLAGKHAPPVQGGAQLRGEGGRRGVGVRMCRGGGPGGRRAACERRVESFLLSAICKGESAAQLAALEAGPACRVLARNCHLRLHSPLHPSPCRIGQQPCGGAEGATSRRMDRAEWSSDLPE